MIPSPSGPPPKLPPGPPSARRRGRPPTGQSSGIQTQRVEAVERALSILDAFAADHLAMTLAELAERTGLYPSTILRLAGSLTRFGYLHRDAEGRFRIGPAPLRLGALYRNALRVTDHVRPVLARLVERTEETAAFYVRDGDRRICLYRHHTPRLIRHHIDEGAALPLDRGASAHVLRAFTDANGDPALRRRGYAVSLGERDPDTAAIAAPVFGPGPTLAGALGITGPLTRFTNADTAVLTAAVVEAAEGLTRDLGGEVPA